MAGSYLLVTTLGIIFPLKVLGDSDTYPQNETPLFITEVFNTGIFFLTHYGWYVLLVVALLIYALLKVWPQIAQWKQKLDEDAYNKKLDYDTVRARQEAMDIRYRKLQEELNAQAQLHLEQEKKKDEQKRLQKIENWENHQEGKGYRNKYKPKDDLPQLPSTMVKKKPIKPNDSNPLMGFGSGSNYRPSGRCTSGG